MAAFFTNLASSGGTYQCKNSEHCSHKSKSDARKPQPNQTQPHVLSEQLLFPVQTMFGPKKDQAFCSQQAAVCKQCFVGATTKAITAMQSTHFQALHQTLFPNISAKLPI